MCLGCVKVSGPNHNGNMFYFQMPQHKHFFSKVRNGLKIMVSGLNHLLGRFKTSDLVQSGRDTSPDVVGGLRVATVAILVHFLKQLAVEGG